MSGSSPIRASGASGPVLHGGRGLSHRQVGELGDERGFVLGEQSRGAVLEVGDDRLDLTTGQHTVTVGHGGDREGAQPPASHGMASGIAAGTPRVVAEPGAHGRGTVVAPHLGGVVFTDSSEQLGIEPIKQHNASVSTTQSMGRSSPSIAFVSGSRIALTCSVMARSVQVFV